MVILKLEMDLSRAFRLKSPFGINMLTWLFKIYVLPYMDSNTAVSFYDPDLVCVSQASDCFVLREP